LIFVLLDFHTREETGVFVELFSSPPGKVDWRKNVQDATRNANDEREFPQVCNTKLSKKAPVVHRIVKCVGAECGLERQYAEKRCNARPHVGDAL
jgi:hypothetical protein